MKKLFELSLSMLIIFICMTSCKKSVSVCQDEIASISTAYTNGSVHNSNTQTYQYINGRSNNTIYSNDSIITYGGIFVYLLDANGRPTAEDDIDGSHYTFSYQPDGYLSQILYYLAGQSMPVTTSINTWQGGNLVQVEFINASIPDTNFSFYTYYSYPFQDLNPFDVATGNQTKNMVKQIITIGGGYPAGGDTTLYTYQFDSKGRVSSYIQTTGDTTSYNYTLTYECN